MESSASPAVPLVQDSGAARATAQASRQSRVGVAYGLAAFGWWGLITIYFKAVAHVPAWEVLAHRVVFSTVLLWGWLAMQGRLGLATSLLRNRRMLLALGGSTVLIASNWLVFIWAIGHGHVTQASLGYFINPLLNVMLGCVFLGERLQTAQKWSVLLAGTGVVILTVGLQEVPTVALVLPATFGLYGLVRKVIPVDGLVGLTVETTMLVPLAVAYLAPALWQGTAAFGSVSRATDILLLAAGVVTALPLIWFLNAARRLRLSTLGFLQYIAPSVQLLLGVTVYGEAFTWVHLVSFSFVWMGLAVYAAGTVRQMRMRQPTG